MDKPLSGLSVLDFSTLLPGPHATQIMADMGAEVLRIEAPKRVDLVRRYPPFVDGVAVVHSYLNRGKRSLALDLKKPEALGIIKGLLKRYTIIVEQFRPAVMTRLGLGYELLAEQYPELIYCSITGYGQSGPRAEKAGHDINYLALSGCADQGRRSGESPCPQGVQIADMAAGAYQAVMAILAAVHGRQESGQGCHIDISMADGALALNALSAPAALLTQQSGGAEQLLNGESYYDYYETRDGRYMAVGCLEPQFFQALCETLERPDLIPLGQDPMQQDILKKALIECFKAKDFAEWCELFVEVDACVEPVLSLSEALYEPHFLARKMVTEVEQKGKGQPQLASPVCFNGVRLAAQYGGRALGEDSATVLQALGYSIDEITALQQQGVVALVEKPT